MLLDPWTGLVLWGACSRDQPLSLMSNLNFPRRSSTPFSHVLLLVPREWISSSCSALQGGVCCPEGIPWPLSLLLSEPWALFSFHQVRSRCLTCLEILSWGSFPALLLSASSLSELEEDSCWSCWAILRPGFYVSARAHVVQLAFVWPELFLLSPSFCW